MLPTVAPASLTLIGSDTFPSITPMLYLPISIHLDSLTSASTCYRWSSMGALFLSNVRLVFVSATTDPSGLKAFDFPLVYLRNDKLHQPIFFANNLTGVTTL